MVATSTAGIRAPLRATAIMALVGGLAAPLAGAEPADLPALADFEAYVDALGALANEPASGPAFQLAEARFDRLAHPIRELAPDAADLLVQYHGMLQEARRDGNASDVRDLARAAHGTATGQVLPAAKEWAVARTHVTTGTPQDAGGGRIRVAIILSQGPSGGFGAYDIRVTTPPAGASFAARFVSATVAAGEGEGQVDLERNEARIGAFDAQSLVGVGTGSGPVVLGHVTLQPGTSGNGTIPLVIHVNELVDRSGEPVPAMGLASSVDAAQAVSRSWLPRIVAPVAVVGLAAGAIFAARKFMKV